MIHGLTPALSAGHVRSEARLITSATAPFGQRSRSPPVSPSGQRSRPAHFRLPRGELWPGQCPLPEMLEAIEMLKPNPAARVGNPSRRPAEDFTLSERRGNSRGRSTCARKPPRLFRVDGFRSSDARRLTPRNVACLRNLPAFLSTSPESIDFLK